MFEEAWIFAVSARPKPRSDRNWPAGRIWHHPTGCSLYYWSCPGRIRGRGPLLFLYIEYRDGTGAARYTRMQFQDEAALGIFIQSHLPYWPLNEIDGRRTTDNPIGGSPDATGTASAA